MNVSPIRALANVVTVGTSDYKRLVNVRGTASGWVGETAARSTTNTPQLAEVAAFMGELYANPKATQTMLDDVFFNAEAWLAERFNAYLADPDEYRAIMRNLLHQGGRIHYTHTRITITLDRPDTPRVARALHLLTEELNAEPARLPGDHRPLTYQVSGV